MDINRIKDESDVNLRKYYLDVKLTDATKAIHEQTRYEIERFLESLVSTSQCYTTNMIHQRNIPKSVTPPTMVYLFGSSVNGFGTNDSDLDINIQIIPFGQIGKRTKGERKRIPNTVEKLSDVLEKLPYAKEIFPITGAKVPIVKFKYHMYPATCIDCDLSIDNGVAVASSKLLFEYSKVDDCVPILGIFIKQWAKKAGICGAPNLSSFAWILMVIHYLQHVSVVPYLQDIPDAPGISYASYHSIKFALVDQIDRYFEPCNERSITSLLIGFFNYFSNKYHYGNAIGIRKAAPKTDWLNLLSSGIVRYPFGRIKLRTRQETKFYEKFDHEKIVDAMKKAHSKLTGKNESWKSMSGKELIDFLS